jgi:hypothetical protein
VYRGVPGCNVHMHTCVLESWRERKKRERERERERENLNMRHREVSYIYKG